MTTPTLALGISAAGTREVESLAAAVKQLQGNLTELRNAGGPSGGHFANLDALLNEIKGLRAELNTSLAGMRTELADGFSQMAKQASSGGTAVAGALRTAKTQIQAEASGVGSGAATQLQAVEMAAVRTTSAVHGLTTGLGWNQRAMRELGTEVNELIQGRWNRAIGTVSSLANATGVYTMALSATGAVITGVIVTVATLATAFVKGEKETSNFNNALLLTGGFAGLTKGQFDQLAQTLANNTVSSIGTAKAALLEMAKTGRFTGDALSTLTQDVILTANITGEKLEAVVKDYEKMPAGVHKWAEEHNKSMHFMSDAQLEHIRLLELQGKAQAAMVEVGKLVNAALISQTENLGTLQRGWRSLENAASGAWNAMLGIGRTQTTEEKLQEVSEQIAKARRQFDPSAFGGNAEARAQLPKLLSEQLSLIKQQDIQQTNAQIQAQEKLRESESAGALDAIKSLGLKVDKVAKVREETEKYLANVAKVNAEHPDAKDPFHISDATVDEYKKLIALKYNHTGATQEYHNALKSLTLTLAEYAQQEREVGEAEKFQLAILKTKYTSGEVDFKNYQSQVTAAQAASSATRVKIATEEQDAIQAKLVSLQAAAGKTPHGGDPAQQAKVALDIENVQKQLQDAKLKVAQATNAETLRGLEIQAQALAPAKALIEAGKSQAEMLAHNSELALETLDLDVKRLQAKDNLNRADERAAVLAEKLNTLTKGYSTEIEKLQIGLAKDLEQGVFGDMSTEAQKKNYETLIALIVRLQAEMAKLRGTAAPKILAADDYSNLSKIDAYLKVDKAKAFGEALKGAFKEAGAAMDGLNKSLQDYMTQMATNVEMQKALASDTSISPADRIQRETDLATRQTQIQIKGFADMTEAASGFFDKQSKGYRTLQGVSSAFHAAELAMQVAQMLPKAINAILTQGEGDPYTAFPRMAAMAAIVAALGISVGMSNGGGDGPIAADVQKKQNEGTVLGDATSKSNSIADSLKLLNKTNDLTLTYTVKMAASLKNIEDSIAGVANLVFRDKGLASGVDVPGIQTGVLSRNSSMPMDPLFGSLAGHIAKLDPLLGKLAGGLLALWGKTTQTITDSGFTAKGTLGQFAAGGQGIGQYADVSTTTSSWFGLVKNTTQRQIEGDLSPTLARQFGLLFSNLNATITLAGSALGKNSADVLAMVKNFSVDLPLSIKDLKGSALTDAVNNWISTISDTAAAAILPGLEDFQQVGEGYFQTAVRVAAGVEAADAALKQLGVTAISFTDILDKQGDVSVELFRQSVRAAQGADIGDILDSVSGALKDVVTVYNQVHDVQAQFVNIGDTSTKVTLSLITLAGGLDKLQTSLKSYYDSFFSDAEKKLNTARQIQTTIASAGLNYSTDQITHATRAQFRALVEQYQALGPAGETAYLALLSVAGAFASITDASTITQTALDKLKTAQDAVIAAYQNQTASLKTFITDIQKYLNDLALGSLSPLTPAQKYAEAEQQFQDTLAKAKGGDATAQAQLTKSADNLLQASQAYQASSQGYTNDYNMVKAALHGIVDSATVQEATMNDQLNALNSVNKSVLSVKDAIDNLATAISAVISSGGNPGLSSFNLLTGGSTGDVNTSIGNVHTSADGSVQFGGKLYTLDGSSYTMTQVRDYINGLVQAGNPMAAYTAFKGAGVSLNEADTIMGWAAGTATQWALAQNLPTFARGINVVPNDMVAQLHAGERVLPAADNRVLMDRIGGSADTETRAEIRALRIEFVAAVKELHKDNNTGHAINATETSKAREAIASAVHVSVDKQISHDRSKQNAQIK